MSDYLIGLAIGYIIGTIWMYNTHTITHKEAIIHKCGEYNNTTGKFQFIINKELK